MDDAKLKELRAWLEQRSAELTALADASAESRKPVELDQTTQGRLSRMDAMRMQATAKESDRRRQSELARVKGALKRMEEGAYGECVACGEDIAPRRLESDPAVPTCVQCAQGG
jgi:DnaK suppressor protein